LLCHRIQAVVKRQTLKSVSMKKLFYSFLLLLSLPALAHEPVPVPQNKVSELTIQADSIRQFFAQFGYAVVKETALNMESEYEIPVIVPLTEGTLYQLVFIADPSSRLQEERMYDYDEKQVFYQKKFVQPEGNIISYSYQPQFSEWHMIKPVQVNKYRKNCNGYMMLLKKIN